MSKSGKKCNFVPGGPTPCVSKRCQSPRLISQRDVGQGDSFVITKPGVYQLCEDVTVNTGVAIRINTSCVKLDLNDHLISGNDEACAAVVVESLVESEKVENIEICNGTIKNFSTESPCDDENEAGAGVIAEDALNLRFHNLTVTNARNGLIIRTSELVNIFHCSLVSNTINGLFVANTNDIAINSCQFDLNLFGANIIDSQNVNISRVTAYANRNTGVQVVSSTTLTLLDTIAESSFRGITVANCSKVLLERCVSKANDGDGVSLFDSTDVDVKHCTSSGNSGNGFVSDGVNRAFISDCCANNQGGGGFVLSGECIVVADNTAANNTGIGFSNNATTAKFYGNRAIFNGTNYVNVAAVDVDVATTPYQNVFEDKPV